jgi:prepilin-type N-terminal cleavage/methylation domain-containing protein
MQASKNRGAFTLIELIVVIALILVLTALGAAFLPRFTDSQNQFRAGDQLSQWLLTARQRAKRDGLPTGVRILFDPLTGLANQVEYVQQPDPYTTGTCVSLVNNPSPPPGNSVATFSGVDFQGAALFVGQPDFGLVQPGDYLEANGGGSVHYISNVIQSPPNPPTLVLTNPNIPPLTVPASSYRIIRQPRRLQGEDVQTLPQDMVIDLTNLGTPAALSLNVPTRTVSLPPPGPSQTFVEIVFSPAGSVIGTGTTSGKIILWVRNTTKPIGDPGATTLIAVQIRTGFIAAHPISLSADPYLFTEDGKSSGL